MRATYLSFRNCLLGVCLIASLSAHAQPNDPNERLGLDEYVISQLCMSAQTNSSNIFKNVIGISAFEEALLFEIGEEDMVIRANDTKSKIDISYKRRVAKLWDEKYNKIWCTLGNDLAPQFA